MKKVDITEKLSFEENPVLIVKGKELEVNTDAATVLKIMGIVGDGTSMSPKKIADAYELIFTDEAKKEIDSMKISFDDFIVIVKQAITLISGNSEEEQGE